MTFLATDLSMNESTAHAPQRIQLATPERATQADAPVKIAARDLNFWYDAFHAVKNINMDIPEKRVTALIGPSGCGKSTLDRKSVV